MIATSNQLQEFLQHYLPRAGGSFSMERCTGGRSNDSFRLRLGKEEVILRCPPEHMAADGTAHDVAREYFILSRIFPSFGLVPRPMVLCEDVSIMGRPFFIMEFVDGLILKNDIDHSVPFKEESFRSLSQNFVNVLIDIHSLDHRSMGLDVLGQPSGYVQRQINGWTRQYGRLTKATGIELASLNQMLDWLNRQQLSESSPCLVHNDFKYDNLVLDVEEGKVEITAVLDWELATIGDPLLDLGGSLGYWVEAGDPAPMQELNFSQRPGNFNREELITAYGRFRSVSNPVSLYIFGLVKIVCFSLQIWLRASQAGTLTQEDDQRIRTLLKAIGRNGLRAVELDRVSDL
ncbi:MAG: phosphotransferase family protein [Bacteroidota bacterium]